MRVNNTQIAHKLRVDKSIALGEWQSFTEMERRIKKLGRIDRNDLENYELLNKGMFHKEENAQNAMHLRPDDFREPGNRLFDHIVQNQR